MSKGGTEWKGWERTLSDSLNFAVGMLVGYLVARYTVAGGEE